MAVLEDSEFRSSEQTFCGSALGCVLALVLFVSLLGLNETLSWIKPEVKVDKSCRVVESTRMLDQTPHTNRLKSFSV